MNMLSKTYWSHLAWSCTKAIYLKILLNSEPIHILVTRLGRKSSAIVISIHCTKDASYRHLLLRWMWLMKSSHTNLTAYQVSSIVIVFFMYSIATWFSWEIQFHLSADYLAHTWWYFHCSVFILWSMSRIPQTAFLPDASTTSRWKYLLYLPYTYWTFSLLLTRLIKRSLTTTFHWAIKGCFFYFISLYSSSWLKRWMSVKVFNACLKTRIKITICIWLF